MKRISQWSVTVLHFALKPFKFQLKNRKLFLCLKFTNIKLKWFCFSRCAFPCKYVSNNITLWLFTFFMTRKHVFCLLLSGDWQVCVSSSGVLVSGQNVIRPHAVSGVRVVLLTPRVWLWRAGRAQSQVLTLMPAQRCDTQLLVPRSESCQTHGLCQHPLSNPKVTHTAERDCV